MERRKTALITGAAGGIGKAYATAFAARGYDLVLADREGDELGRLAAELSDSYGISVETMVGDLAVRSDLEDLATRIENHGEINVLVNNAGFGNPGAFAETDFAKSIAMIDVHVVASTWLCRAVLPGMISHGEGAIINLASIGGIPAGPGDVTYSATKRFIIHFSKCLQAELRRHGIKVQALCPGLTRTGFHNAGDYSAMTRGVPGFLWMAPDDLVADSIAALGKRKVVHIPRFKNRVLLALLYFPFVIRVIHAVVRRL